MKLSIAICLLLVVAFLVFADEEKKSVAPVSVVWSTPIEAFAVYGGEPAALRSMMTADTDIKVTRIEAFDEQGPRLNVNGVMTQFVPCSPQPAVTVTDGLTSYTLPLSSTFLPKSAATYTDSGDLNLKFAAGSHVNLIIAPPQSRQSALCMAKQLNVLVHYMPIQK